MRASLSPAFILSAFVALTSVALLAGTATHTAAIELLPGGTFVDDDGNIHEGNIEAIAGHGVTRGCNPPAGDRFCPDGNVTRGQMAAFLVRAASLPATGRDYYFDDDESIFEDDINRLAAAGVTRGCNPPANDRFCPDGKVTRGQMAAFIARAFRYRDDGGGDWFTDDDGSIFESEIDRLRVAGVTAGCNPPINDRYCPADHVRRDQMASLLSRALGLQPTVPPPRLCPVAGPCPSQWPGQEWQASLGADLPKPARFDVLHVDASHPGASNSNSGSATSPLATVQEGLNRAQHSRAKGLSVRVIVHPGVYRESLTIATGSQFDEQPVLRLEAAEPGTAVISGSEVWTGWQRVAATDVWYHSWPYAWGLAPVPDGPSPSEIARRREMVFVDSAHIPQVLSYAELHPISFFVSETEDRLYVHAAGSTDLNARLVEVAVRDRLLWVNGLNNLVVEGLVFQHANQAFYTPAAQIADSRNIEITNVTFRWNNWTGFRLWNASDITLRNSSALHNGGGGIGLGRLSSVRIEDVQTLENNWRGASGGYTGWSVAGMKAMWIRDVLIAQYRSDDNATRGLWLDTDIERVLVDDSQICNNASHGLFVEATQGPVIVEDTLICNNGNAGLLSANATDLALVESTMCSNGFTQILASGDEPLRSFTNSGTGERISIPPARDWSISGTTILDDEPDAPLIHFLVGQAFVNEFASTLVSDNNTWWNPNSDQPFGLGDLTKADFSSWQKYTNQDMASDFENPGAIAGC